MPNRRRFLKVLGGGTILAPTGAVGFLATRTPHDALAPWTPKPYDDPRKAALSYAILAPNPHNLQPWLVELVGQDKVRIHRDTDRELPETDPYHRQLYIGLGAFVETMILAAGALGFDTEVKLLPDGDDGPIAEAVFVPGGAPDPLSDQILKRHSNKEPYTEQRLSKAESSVLENYATLISDEDIVARVRDLTKRAFEIEMRTPQTLKESVDLMRIGKAEINANPDGIELRDPMLETLRLTGLLDNETLMNVDHPGTQSHMRGYFAMLDATPQYAVLTTATNTRSDQLDAGRQLMRFYLKTTEMGLGVHPVSQALQEYPEMANEYALAHELLASPGHTVQMLLRLGYGPEPIATPRWPLETRILNEA
ncbi:Acg family FMN-binding oxidoreductase [Ruegeria meonggei]|uniref:Putative NAD(P)H nitroreductase/MT3217 n=1 Tax=Ruegeria meonggei TaxID=1446476 RepID=A0A1X6ZW88_9RHOB|nr:nitroreductase family protein [Ruegeria meonggei]SLN63207.1 Putative NAD(P)H nitroreductase/MT3217 [Ruegeria meonggei]